VFSRCVTREQSLADKAPESAVNKHFENLANGICAEDCNAIFLNAHNFPPMLGFPDPLNPDL
jgi:hypothetical protein